MNLAKDMKELYNVNCKPKPTNQPSKQPNHQATKPNESKQASKQTNETKVKTKSKTLASRNKSFVSQIGKTHIVKMVILLKRST